MQTGINEQSQTHKETPVNSVLQREIELLRERLTDKDGVIDDLRNRLNEESAERRKLTMILSDMRDKATQKSPEARKGFLARLLG